MQRIIAEFRRMLTAKMHLNLQEFTPAGLS